MSREDENKAIVGRWFTKFWGETCDLGIVDGRAGYAPSVLTARATSGTGRHQGVHDGFP
jgi:hypothetical protein